MADPETPRRRTIAATVQASIPISPATIIELNLAEGRLEQIFIDPANRVLRRRHPTETELAFSLGINGYAKTAA